MPGQLPGTHLSRRMEFCGSRLPVRGAGACGTQANARPCRSGGGAVAGTPRDGSGRTVPNSYRAAADYVSRNGYACGAAAQCGGTCSFLKHPCLGCEARRRGAAGGEAPWFMLAVDSVCRVGLAAREGDSECNGSRAGHQCIRSGQSRALWSAARIARPLNNSWAKLRRDWPVIRGRLPRRTRNR